MWEQYQVCGNDIWVLKQLKGGLKVWNKEIFGDINKKKLEITSLLGI